MARVFRALRGRKPSLVAPYRRLDIKLFKVAVVVTRPAPEGAIKTVHLSVAELPRHTLAGQPPFFEHHRAPLSAHVIEDALVVGAICTQPAAQCGGADVERIGYFFRAQSEQITIKQQIDDTQRGARQLVGCALGDANAEFRRYRWQWSL